jgi:TatD DNase family protein
MWIDSHAHLYDLDEPSLSAAVNAVEAAGVLRVVNTATSLATSTTVIAQCRRNKNLSAVVGISPFDAESLPDSWYGQLEILASGRHILAIGETGLDSTSPRYPDTRLQLPVFEGQLDIAKKRDLPVILHSRGSESAVADVCVGSGIKKAMFHCFTGSIASLRKLLDAGYYVSFSGIITFANSPVAACVEYAPIDRILIETDSPYLAPVPFRGKKNRPAWVAFVGKKVAEIKKLDEESLAAALGENFARLFGDRPAV